MSLDLLRTMFDAAAAVALAPLVTLTVGVLLLLVAELAPALSRHRPAILVAAILGALWCEVLVHANAPGLVLDGTFLADEHTAVWGMIFLSSALVAWAFGQRYYRASRTFLGEHDVLLLCTPIGMMLMAGAQDLIVFFVGLELLSIPLYCLAAFRRTRNDSVEAGLKYFVLGAFAAATFLYGAGLLYAGTGSISLVELRRIAAETGIGSPLALMGAGLVTASLFFKASVFPFHLWVPDVYQGSPTPVTALMATGTKAAAFAVLLNVAFLLPSSTALVLAAIALLTMVFGNLGALVQTDLKRMLAYSSVAHAGTLLLLVAALVAGPADPGRIAPEAFRDEVIGAALFYMAAYVFTAGGAFGLVSWLEADGERFTRLASLRGLAGRRPGVAAGLALFVLSLGGLPATGGFLGKYLVFSAVVRAGMVWIAVAGALLSVVALGYYLRVVVALYMEPEPEGQAPPMTRRLSASLTAGVCAVAVVALGVLPGLFLDGLL